MQGSVEFRRAMQPLKEKELQIKSYTRRHLKVQGLSLAWEKASRNRQGKKEASLVCSSKIESLERELMELRKVLLENEKTISVLKNEKQNPPIEEYIVGHFFFHIDKSCL